MSSSPAWRHWVCAGLLAVATLPLSAKEKLRFMERLDRGVVAVQQPDGKVFVSWRLLADDAPNVAFNIYRETAAPAPGAADPGRFAARPDAPANVTRLNTQPLTEGTWFLDTSARLDRATSYSVAAVVDGIEQPKSAPFRFAANAPPLPYYSIPLQTPPGYTPNDASVGVYPGGVCSGIE